MNSIVQDPSAKDAYDVLLLEFIIPLFKKYGFTRKRGKWSRTYGDLYCQVKIRNSVCNTRENISFRFDIALYLEEDIDKPIFINGKPEKWEWDYDNNLTGDQNQFLPRAHTNVSKEFNDSKGWYLLNDYSHMEGLKIQLGEDLERHIFPTFQRINNKKDYLFLISKKLKLGVHKRLNLYEATKSKGTK